jgi:hypothetical protein
MRRGRLQPLDEAQCYARLHGERDPSVRVVSRRAAPAVPPRPERPPAVRLSGEDLRRLFEQKLDGRDA